jgi:hypothetical protein
MNKIHFSRELLEKFPIEEEDKIVDNTLNNSNVIKNISYDQSEILWNIMKLYNNGEPFECDITASELKFYGKRPGSKYEIPEPKLLFDVYPQSDKIKKITPFQPLPLEDDSIGSEIVDLPFVISPKTAASAINPKEGSNLIMKRFSSWYPYREGYYNIYWWIKEAARVLKDNGILVWKFQDTISGSINHRFIQFSAECAMNFGFYVVDEFILEAKARLISASKIKKQMHARKYTSNFLVFIKDKKKAEKFSTLNMLEECKREVHEGYEFELK